MPKRLVVLSDGTGNSAGKAEKTNVWRTFQAIDQSKGAQLVMYDDGVGTSSNKYLAALGGAFGWGLKRNVVDLYVFICRNYKVGDEIFGFGFSRGAFTIRTLIDFIVKEGLVAYNSEEELHRNARRAYANYRKSCFKPTLPWISPVSLYRLVDSTASRLVDAAAGRKSLEKRIAGKQMPVRFLGLWDTVGAYGMPIEEFKPVVNFLFWPMMWDNLRLSPQVQRACHALSLDDERTTFHPIVWDERCEETLIRSGDVMPDRLSQVWFAGVHANVGGGYPEDQLSLISLDWILSQAKAAGLVLGDNAVSSILQYKSSYARLYDPRSGLGGYYRYTPRVINTYGTSGPPIWPVIHHSVLMRMMHGSDDYAPLPLPQKFHVLGLDGILYDNHLVDYPRKRQGSGVPQTMDAHSATQPHHGESHCQRLQDALKAVSTPDPEAQALAQDTVWWRRLTYFASVGLTFALASLPWAGPALSTLAQEHAVLRAIGGPASDGLKGIFGLMQAGLPAFTRPWTNAFVEYPLTFLTLGASLLCSFILSQLLNGRIRDHNQYAWHSGLRERYLLWMAGHVSSLIRNSAAALIFAAALLAWRWPNPLETLLSGLIAAVAVWSISGAVNLRRNIRKKRGLPSTASLLFARKVRTNEALVRIYRWLSQVGVPIVIGILLVAAITVTANRALFAVVSASGHYCTDKVPPALVGVSQVTIDQVCAATGIKVKAGHQYRITLRDPDGMLFDRTTHTGLGGFEGASTIHRTSKLLRRWWSENWLTPIVRIGERGSEEYALHPDDAYESSPPADPDVSCDKTALSWCRTRFDKPDGKTLLRIAQTYPTPSDRRTLTTTITPQKDGQLFLYVNDVTFFLDTRYYLNNVGALQVTVEEAAKLRGGDHGRQLSAIEPSVVASH